MNPGYTPYGEPGRRIVYKLVVEKYLDEQERWVRTALAPDLESAAKHARSVGGRVQALTRDGDFVAQWEDGVLVEAVGG